ncbi:MAG: DUF6782 family putative metallopeptidase [Pseudomonadota bacterium]
MTDIIGIQTGKNNAAHRVCRVSYTLNNTQPVASTIIGDQPLFYMDYDVDYEDDEIFDAAELKILESELNNLQKEIKSLDRFTEEFVQSPEERFALFVEDKENFTKQQSKASTDIDVLKSILQQSRLGNAYLQCAAQHEIEIKFSSQIEDAYYDRRAGQILINEALEEVGQVLLCSRELRRHWQHRQGALIHPLMFHPDNAVLINRMQVADLTVSMIRTAWELQLSSYKGAWERIENSSMGDLGRAFAREAFLDFRTVNNGQASAAVLESWFLSERCREEDKKLIQNMLADHQGYVFDLEEAETSVTPALIAALGEMPFGKNYLSEHVQTLMNDPIFTDVRDRSNANFLWFIKFERSFRETEQELQSNPEHTAEGIRQAAEQKENQGYNNGTIEEAGEIIELYAGQNRGHEEAKSHKESGKRLSTKTHKSQQSAEIIYLRRWSGE